MVRGDLARIIFDIMRRADTGLTTTEIARRVADVFGLPEDDHLSRRWVRDRVEGALYRQKDRLVITGLRDGQNTIWRVAD